MTEQTQVLRQAKNNATVVGLLNEKNLKLGSKTRDDGTVNEYINGDISVRTGEHEVHKIRFYAGKYTKAGAENNQYKGLVTIMNEAVSVADAKDNPDAVVDHVRVFGGIELNEYYGRDGNLASNQVVNGRFVTRLDKPDDDRTPKAEFSLEGVVQSVSPEYDREGEETGRAKLGLIVPGYGGKVEPMNFVVVEEGSDYVQDTYSKGDTVEIVGKIVNEAVVSEKTIAMGFGKDKVETTTSYKNELIIVSGTEPYDEDSPQKFNVELIQPALQRREVYLEGLKTASEQRANKPAAKTGFGAGATTPTAQKEANNRPDVSNFF